MVNDVIGRHSGSSRNSAAKMRLPWLLLASMMWFAALHQHEAGATRRSRAGQAHVRHLSARSGQGQGHHLWARAVTSVDQHDSLESMELLAFRDLRKLESLEAALDSVTREGVGGDEDARDEQKGELAGLLAGYREGQREQSLALKTRDTQRLLHQTVHPDDTKRQPPELRALQVQLSYAPGDTEKARRTSRHTSERTSRHTPERTYRHTSGPGHTDSDRAERASRHTFSGRPAQPARQARRVRRDVVKIVERGSDDDDDDDDDDDEDDDDNIEDMMKYGNMAMYPRPGRVRYVPVPVPVPMHRHWKKRQKHVLELPRELIQLIDDAQKAKEKKSDIRIIEVAAKPAASAQPPGPPGVPAPPGPPGVPAPPGPPGPPPMGPPPPPGMDRMNLVG